MSEHALAPVDPLPTSAYPQNPLRTAAGMNALAMMSEQEFQTRLQALKQGQNRIKVIHKELMTKDVDYGHLTGTEKAILYKSGAEKLALFYGLVPEFLDAITYGPGPEAAPRPEISIVTTCLLHLGDINGPVVGSAKGNCNNWEKKYRYRYAELMCPACGVRGSIRKGREEYGGGWFCHRSSGCGATFLKADPAIVQQPRGLVDSPDPFDLLNTLIKMSHKRALVAAVLLCTATSGLYTQDLEDSQPEEAPAPQAQAAERPEAPQAPTQRPDAQRPDTAPQPQAGTNGQRNGQKAPDAPQNAPKADEPAKCSNAICSKPLTKGQAMVSERAFGRLLCPNCQKTQNGDSAPAQQPAAQPAAPKAPQPAAQSQAAPEPAGDPMDAPVAAPAKVGHAADLMARPASDTQKEQAMRWVDAGLQWGVIEDAQYQILRDVALAKDATIGQLAELTREMDAKIKAEQAARAQEAPLTAEEEAATETGAPAEEDPFEDEVPQ